MRHLLDLLIVKTCPGCEVMKDYLTWLDNTSTGDTRAAAYIMAKVSGAGSVGVGWTGSQYNANFPNFDNQFEGV